MWVQGDIHRKKEKEGLSNRQVSHILSGVDDITINDNEKSYGVSYQLPRAKTTFTLTEMPVFRFKPEFRFFHQV